MFKMLFKWLRVLSTGFSFTVFMVWGFFLGAFLYPLLRIIFRDSVRRRQIFLNHMRWVWRIFIKMMELIKAFDKIEITGIENFVQNRAALVIANHITLVDIVALGSVIENFNCVVKESLWKQPFFGSVVRACDFVPNSGSSEFIDLCQKGFDADRPLIVFPQGTRIPPDTAPHFQRGAAQIALRTGVPIIPVIITCNPVTLSKGVPWYKVPSRAAHLKLDFQSPVQIPDDINSIQAMPQKVRALTAFLEDYYKTNLK
jgi:1-acyl-sn-glycerol-3-phosphate acyltransferase